jgi:hypothetical protein
MTARHTNNLMEDACQHCGHTYDWRGEEPDRPPCPRCGHTISIGELEANRAVRASQTPFDTTQPRERFRTGRQNMNWRFRPD